MARFLGEGIDESVAKQIEARGTIMSRSPRNEADLKYLNQKTGWVRVTSMVDTSDGIPTPITSDDSKSLILQGGSVRLTDNGLRMRSGMSFQGDTGAAYNTTDTFGTRPMPGITDFTVISKNRFGTIREANVSFNVWSLEDLEKVEKLFFRAGYSCVIEWGHSVYVDNDGNIQNASGTVNYSTFFTVGKRDEYQEIINNQKNKTNHNYDGLIGLIKNFRWSFRKDGGYDCSISVISLGEVIQSIRANTVMTGFKLPKDSEEDDTTLARPSPFHFLAYLLEKGVTFGEGKAVTVEYATVLKRLAEKGDGLNLEWAKLFSQLTERTSRGGLGPSTPGGDNLILGYKYKLSSRTWYFAREEASVFYISLRTFLAMINRFYMIKLNEGDVIPRFNTDSKQINGDLKPDPTFRTYEGHFSADPFTVLLPIPPQGKLVPELPTGVLRVKGNGSTDTNNIFDLVISLPYIIEKLDPLLQGDDQTLENVYDFVQSVLDGLESPLGGINDFDITYDEDTATYAVVDRANVKHSAADKKSLPQINLVGLKSTATDISVETKITNKLVSTIAIAAQAEPKGYAQILASQVAWNRGFVDRVLPTKSQSSTPSTTDKDENLQEREAEYDELLQKTYGRLTNVSPVYDKQTWNSLVPESKFFQSRAANLNPVAKQPLAGIVPVEVSFTMDGISSLKIGEVFTIPKNILPPNYEIFSYIITGLEHSIQGEKWMSKIKANPLVYP